MRLLCCPRKIRRRGVPQDVSGVKVQVEENKLEHVEQGKHNTLTRVNQYKIESILGKGNFGAVYRALDHNQEYVAIKVMEKAEIRKKSKGLQGRPNPMRPPPNRGSAAPGIGTKAAAGSTLVSMIYV